MDATDKDKLEFAQIIILMIVVGLLCYSSGRLVGFNDALNGSYVDDQGRNCLATEMYIPTERGIANQDIYGWFVFNSGRQLRFYCEDNDKAGR